MLVDREGKLPPCQEGFSDQQREVNLSQLLPGLDEIVRTVAKYRYSLIRRHEQAICPQLIADINFYKIY